MGQPSDPMQKKFHPSLCSLKRGEKPIPNSMCVGGLYGKKSNLVEQVYFYYLGNSLTICMQAMAPTKSNFSCRSHGKYGANKISKASHCLEMQREIFYHDGCFPKAPNESFTFSHVKVAYAANMWWEYHLSHSDLLRTRSVLRWYLMWDCDPPPHVHISGFL